MKTRKELINQISVFDKIDSITGNASYSKFKIEGDRVSFKRDRTGNRQSVDFDSLYNAYKNESFLNTVILRNYISKWVFSPALAILIAAGFYDKTGNRIK